MLHLQRTLINFRINFTQFLDHSDFLYLMAFLHLNLYSLVIRAAGGKSVSIIRDLAASVILDDKVSSDWVVVLLFYVHGTHLRSCRDGQLT